LVIWNFSTDANAHYHKTTTACIHGSFKPIVKLFCPWSGATWLLSELDPEDHDLAFGLCDLGMGFPELGRVRLSELNAVRGPGGLRIERDRWFRPNETLSAYADEARRHERIVA
jgi:hypothetical protein